MGRTAGVRGRDRGKGRAPHLPAATPPADARQPGPGKGRCWRRAPRPAAHRPVCAVSPRLPRVRAATIRRALPRGSHPWPAGPLASARSQQLPGCPRRVPLGSPCPPWAAWVPGRRCPRSRALRAPSVQGGGGPGETPTDLPVALRLWEGRWRQRRGLGRACGGKGGRQTQAVPPVMPAEAPQPPSWGRADPSREAGQAADTLPALPSAVCPLSCLRLVWVRLKCPNTSSTGCARTAKPGPCLPHLREPWPARARLACPPGPVGTGSQGPGRQRAASCSPGEQ